MKKFFIEIFQDEKGSFSSKRFVGIMCAITLCATMCHNQFTDTNISPSDSLINAVTALAFGALGLTSADKIFKKSNKGEE